MHACICVSGLGPAAEPEAHCTRTASSPHGTVRHTLCLVPPPPGPRLQIIAQLVVGGLSPREMAELRRLFSDWLLGLFTPLAYDSPPFPFHTSMNARRWVPGGGCGVGCGRC